MIPGTVAVQFQRILYPDRQAVDLRLRRPNILRKSGVSLVEVRRISVHLVGSGRYQLFSLSPAPGAWFLQFVVVSATLLSLCTH